MKEITIFHSKIIFTAVKYRSILHGRVIVMIKVTVVDVKIYLLVLLIIIVTLTYY